MRKTIFAILAAAAMVACSNDELVNADREAIAFDNAFVDNATRSVVDPSYSNTNLFANFKVYGYVNGAELFDGGALVSKDINNAELSSDWKYASTQYWIEGGVYDFQAVAPADKYTVKANSNDGIHLEFTNDGVTDLLYAKTNPYTAAASGNLPVAFNFKHILSKVKFSFENAYNAHNTTIRVHDIQIVNARGAAGEYIFRSSLDFGNATDDQSTTDVKEGADATDLVPFGFGKTYESYHERLLIPTDYTTEKLPVKFQYDVLVGGTSIKTFTVTTGVPVNLEPGHAYDFKAVIKPGQAIEFTVNPLTDWENGNTADDATDNDSDHTTIK